VIVALYAMLFLGAMIVLYMATEIGSKYSLVALAAGVIAAVAGGVMGDTTLFVVGVALVVLSSAPLVADALKRLESGAEA